MTATKQQTEKAVAPSFLLRLTFLKRRGWGKSTTLRKEPKTKKSKAESKNEPLPTLWAPTKKKAKKNKWGSSVCELFHYNDYSVKGNGRNKHNVAQQEGKRNRK